MTVISKKYVLAGLFTLQLFCVLFPLADTVADVFSLHQLSLIKDTDGFEYAVMIALIISMTATGLEILQVMQCNQRVKNQLKAASGAFSELLDLHFETWNLTVSERDVALLAIKSLGIADLRSTKEGNIKAQPNATYRKAEVTGRPQLISLFVEELMGGTLATAST